MLILSILEYNTVTEVLAGLICFALVFIVEHHVTRDMKNYRLPKRYKALNQLSVRTLEWIILPIEIIFAIGSAILTVVLLVIPLNLNGLLARLLSGIF